MPPLLFMCGMHTCQRARRNAVPRVLFLAQRHKGAVKGGEEAAPHRKAAADARRLPPDGLQQRVQRSAGS